MYLLVLREDSCALHYTTQATQHARSPLGFHESMGESISGDWRGYIYAASETDRWPLHMPRGSKCTWIHLLQSSYRSVRGWQNLFNYSKVYVRGEKWCLADFVFGEMSGWLPTIPCVRKLYSWEWARMHDHVLLNITKIAFLPGSLQENLYM